MEFYKFIFTLLISYSPVLVSRVFLIHSPENWYREIIRPEFTPPPWVFGTVWSILYFLIAVSLFLFCVAEGDSSQKRLGFIFFALQLLLNAAFMPVYVGLRSFLGAFLICVFLAVFLLLTIIQFYKVSKISAYLLIPYLCWGIFAIVLSYKVYVLNV